MSGNPSARTLFARACATGDLAAVEARLAAGARLGPLNPKRLTPLHLAAFTGGSPEVVRRLVEAGADVDARIGGRITAFRNYVGRARVARRELATPDTPLHAALGAVGHPLWRDGTAIAEIVAALLDADADPNAPGGSGTPPLVRIAYEKWGQVPEIMRLLLAAGADRDAVGFGTTPLFAAVHWRNEPAVALLLSVGADPCRREVAPSGATAGTTPLHMAAKTADESTMRLMIAASGDVDVGNARGVPPLHIAVGAGEPERVRLLLEAGADPRFRLDEPFMLGEVRVETSLDLARARGLDRIAGLLEAA